MSITAIVILVMVSLIVGLLTGLPVAFCVFGIALLFTLIFLGPAALVMAFNSVFNVTTTDIFIAIPLFILMATVLQFSGIASALYALMYKWFAGLRGGLAIGTTFICTIIAAMTGLGGTGTVTMGMIAYPEMEKRGYSKSIMLGCIPTGGALGPLIPPSIIMIIIGGFASVSIGKMFIGGIIPGLFMAGLFMLYIGIRCGLRPELGPAIAIEERSTWGEKFSALRGLILPLMLIVVVLGSIYTGIATPTEAAGVGAFGALICAIINRQLNWENLKSALFTATRVTCMCFWLVIGGTAFSIFLGWTGGRHFIAEILTGLPLAPIGIIIVMQLIGLFLGMFMDAAAISVICVPMFMPVVLELGFDPLWFTLVLTINMIIGYITPPFGFNLFYLKGVVPPDVSMMDIYRAVIPFVGLMLIVLVVSVIFPPLVLWLPSLMIK